MASCNDKNALRGHGAFWESKEGWFGTFLELPYGIPSHGTLGRIFTASDPKKFLEAFMRGEIPPCLIGRRWKRGMAGSKPGVIGEGLHRLVCREGSMGVTAQRGRGGSGARDRWKDQRRAPLPSDTKATQQRVKAWHADLDVMERGMGRPRNKLNKTGEAQEVLDRLQNEPRGWKRERLLALKHGLSVELSLREIGGMP